MPGYSTYPGNSGYPGSYGGYNGGLYGGESYPSGNFVAPGSGVTPTYVPNGSGGPTPTYVPPNNGSSIPSGSGADRLVPDPTDPNNPYFPRPNEQFFPPGGTTSITPPAGTPSNNSTPSNSAESPLRDSTNRTEFDETRTASIPNRGGRGIQPISMIQPDATATTGGNGGEKDGYGYGPEYIWMEGTVAYDQSDRSWNIIYDLSPSPDDEYSGHFALSKNPVLQVLRDGESVRLEGSVDPVEKDRFGKPTYLVTRVIQSRNRR